MAKQVFRRRDASGRFAGDHVTRADESAEGEPLLVPIVRAVATGGPLPALEAIRARAGSNWPRLPARPAGPRCAGPIIRSPTAMPSRPMRAG